jgi:hypothetical protein
LIPDDFDEERVTIQVSVTVPWTPSHTAITRKIPRTEWERLSPPMREALVERAAYELVQYMTLNEENR